MARWVPTFAGTTLLLLAAVQASHRPSPGRRRLLSGQDAAHRHQHRCRRRLRRICEAAVGAYRQAYPRSAACDRAEHARCRRAAGGEFPLCVGAAGRHHHRHHQLDGAVRAALGQQGRAFRHLEVQLARHPRPRRRRVHALAHFAGEDLGRHAGQGVHGREHRRGFGDGALPGDVEQAVRDQDQGDRGLQGRQRHRPRDGARRARRPLRHPSHLVQGAASRLVRRTQDPGAGHHRRAPAGRPPRHAPR